MKTALIISTYNSPAHLRKCLSSLKEQILMPDEVIIADDGSGEETKLIIDAFRQQLALRTQVVHVWHEDKGFRKSMILNKAIAVCNVDYIIQIDGDVYMDRHFIKDHVNIARKGYWVNGSRVWLGKGTTEKLFAGKNADALHWWKLPLSSLTNSFRSRVLRNMLKNCYAIKKVDHMRGCNMAFWREDAIRVNGYNEDLTSWGHEDGEFALRLHFAGVRKQSLKMGGIAYHMYHKPSSRNNEQLHLDTIERLKREKTKRCTNGIDKYL